MPSVSVDEFLKEHSRGVFLATIEAVEAKPEECKLTPWEEGLGCLCSSALIVPKTAIASVTTTEHRHRCCGKVLVVVEVHFKEGSTLPLQEIWSQLSSAERLSQSSHQSLNVGAPAGQVFPAAFAPMGQPFSSITVSEAAMNPQFFQTCAPPNIVMNCAGQFVCVPPGSTCCATQVCVPPFNVCMNCAGRFVCVAPGSTCCATEVCAPGQRCVNEGGRIFCR
jgi:hypothetical protein